MKKKTFFIILTIFILGFFGYWGVIMYQFAKGVKEDAIRMNKFKEQHPNGTILIDEELIKSKDVK